MRKPYMVEDIMKGTGNHPVDSVEEGKAKIKELFDKAYPARRGLASMEYMTAYYCLMEWDNVSQSWDCACHLTRL